MKESSSQEVSYEARKKASVEASSRVSSHGGMSPRERLAALFDGGEFTELGGLAMQPPLPFGRQDRRPGDGVLTAFGKVNGRRVAAIANVYDYMGGSIGVTGTRKMAELFRLAGEVGAPVVTFAESAGARLQEGIDIMEACGFEWSARASLSGVIPQIAAVVGPCIGAAAVTAAMSDLVLWTGSGVLALAGPRVVREATGQDLGYAEIGGPGLHGRDTGLCHRLCASEEELIEEIRLLLSMLPSNNAEEPAGIPAADPVDRDTTRIPEILEKAGDKPFDCRDVIRDVVDDGFFYEIAPDYGPALVAGFARLGGRVLAIAANQSRVMSGALDTDACRKGARFLAFANAFNLPLLSLVDVPGALPTVEETRKGLLNGLVNFAMQTCRYEPPRVSVLVRKCFGGAYACLNPKSGGGDLVFAYPRSAVGIMSGSALASVLFKERAQEMVSKIGCRLDDPLLAAERGYIDDIIEPSDTRRRLAAAFSFLAEKRVICRQPKRNANPPL